MAAILFLAFIIAPFTIQRSGLESNANFPDGILGWDGTIAARYQNESVNPALNIGLGTAARPYEIHNGQQLARMAQQVNNGNHTSSHFVLAQYISLNPDRNHWFEWEISGSSYMWTPIGTASRPFTGTFEGGDKYIGGIWIDRPTSNYQGLFGVVGHGGIVRNLTIYNSFIRAKSYVGSVAGRALLPDSAVPGAIGGTLSNVGNFAIHINGTVGTQGTPGVRNPSAPLGVATPTNGPPSAGGDVRNGDHGETVYVGGIVGHGNVRDGINRSRIIGSVGGAGGDGWSAGPTDYGMSGGHGGNGGRSYTGGITGYGNVTGRESSTRDSDSVNGANGGNGGAGGRGGDARVIDSGVITNRAQASASARSQAYIDDLKYKDYNGAPTNSPGVVTAAPPLLPGEFPTALGSEYSESYEPLRTNAAVTSVVKNTNPAGHGGNGGHAANSYTGGWTAWGNVENLNDIENIWHGRVNSVVNGASGGSGGRGGDGGAGLTAIVPYADKVTISGIELDFVQMTVGDTHNGSTHHSTTTTTSRTHSCTMSNTFTGHCCHVWYDHSSCNHCTHSCGAACEDGCIHNCHHYCDPEPRHDNCYDWDCYHSHTNSYTAPAKVWVTERFDIIRWLTIVEDSGHGGHGGLGRDSFTGGFTATGEAKDVVNNASVNGALGGRGGDGGDGGTPVPPRSQLSRPNDVRTVNKDWSFSVTDTHDLDCRSCYHPCCGRRCSNRIVATCNIHGTRYYRGTVVARQAFSYDVSARGGNGGNGNNGGDSYVHALTAAGYPSSGSPSAPGPYVNSYCNGTIEIPRLEPAFIFDSVRGVMRPVLGGWGGEGGISNPASYSGIGGADGANGKEANPLACDVPTGYPNPSPPPQIPDTGTPPIVVDPPPDLPIHIPGPTIKESKPGRSGGGWIPLDWAPGQLGTILIIVALGGFIVLFGVLFGPGIRGGKE